MTTRITPGTHTVVGEAFTGTIPAGTPYISLWNGERHVVAEHGRDESFDPANSKAAYHRLTVEAPIPTPDTFEPGTVADVTLTRDARGYWRDSLGKPRLGSDSRTRDLIAAGTARLTHVPTPPAMTRQDAVNALAGLGWTTDAIEDAIGATS